jgi:hypothetical protein
MTVSSPVPPPPGSPQAPKKGLSPLAWVGIGCAVIVVLGIVALGGLGVVGSYFIKKKAAEFDKNPTMAAAEMVVRLNPDLELVSKDEKTNTLTVKNKKTGEVVSFSADDAKAGKFTFKSDKGTATFDASGKDGGVFKVTDEKGQTTTVNAGAGAPQNLPSWVPSYPGGNVQGTYDTNGPQGRSAAFVVTTKDSVSKMMDFYETQLKSAGLKVEKTTFSSNGQDGGTITAKSDDEKKQASVLFGTANGETSATVTYQEKK